jgi:hypothetical protein
VHICNKVEDKVKPESGSTEYTGNDCRCTSTFKSLEEMRARCILVFENLGNYQHTRKRAASKAVLSS